MPHICVILGVIFYTQKILSFQILHPKKYRLNLLQLFSSFHTFTFSLSLLYFHQRDQLTCGLNLLQLSCSFHTFTFTLLLSHFHCHTFNFTFTPSLSLSSRWSTHLWIEPLAVVFLANGASDAIVVLVTVSLLDFWLEILTKLSHQLWVAREAIIYEILDCYETISQIRI